MEPMYMIEVFIDKIVAFDLLKGGEADSKKKFIVTLKFGTIFEFAVSESELVAETSQPGSPKSPPGETKDMIRFLRIGKSYTFPCYPDTLIQMLNKFPFEVYVWTNDEQEEKSFVGNGKMTWDPEFFEMIRNSADHCKKTEPLTTKETIKLSDEGYCCQLGYVNIILRITSLGSGVTTTFQQMQNNPEAFVFKTDKTKNLFECKRVEEGDPNFIIMGSLYESTTLEDPEITNAAETQYKVCTELDSCGIDRDDVMFVCGDEFRKNHPKKPPPPIKTIKMRDIRGPCGNANCPIAEKIKMYIRKTEYYKKQIKNFPLTDKVSKDIKECGKCICDKDPSWHRQMCPEYSQRPTICKDCGGISKTGATCQDNDDVIQKALPQHIKDIMLVTGVETLYAGNKKTSSKEHCGCIKRKGQQSSETGECNCLKANIERESNKQLKTTAFPPVIRDILVCTDTDAPYPGCTNMPDGEDCGCEKPKPEITCGAFDCKCMRKAMDRETRKIHKPFCPSYRHKDSCPITKMNQPPVENLPEENVEENSQENVESYPFGLPPVKLGPCPVVGRPCSVPGGFVKMYKTAAEATIQPSYDESGKICCSKEFDRIKRYLNDLMKPETTTTRECPGPLKPQELEGKCCDKGPKYSELSGASCCGKHKLKPLSSK